MLSGQAIITYSYKRQGQTNLWRRGSKGTVNRITEQIAWNGPGVRMTHQGESLAIVEVSLEVEDEGFDEAEWEAWQAADAEFSKRYPGVDLADHQ